jgi:hypothetical protein
MDKSPDESSAPIIARVAFWGCLKLCDRVRV